MLLPRPPAAGLGAHPVQRAGGHEPQGAAESLAARHTLPQRKGTNWTNLNDICTGRGHGWGGKGVGEKGEMQDSG